MDLHLLLTRAFNSLPRSWCLHCSGYRLHKKAREKWFGGTRDQCTFPSVGCILFLKVCAVPALWAAGSAGKCPRPGSRKLLGHGPPARTSHSPAHTGRPDPRGRSPARVARDSWLPGHDPRLNPDTRGPQGCQEALSPSLSCVRARGREENPRKGGVADLTFFHTVGENEAFFPQVR